MGKFWKLFFGYKKKEILGAAAQWRWYFWFYVLGGVAILHLINLLLPAWVIDIVISGLGLFIIISIGFLVWWNVQDVGRELGGSNQ